ncbi:MAG: protein kinase, partial [Myxococcales bacterium]|nr:protein kinase [Myxococcales bacterium]
GVVLGSYRIRTLLGRGGMGFVFRAEHTKLGREVALKLLRRDYATRRDAVARFFQEARTVNRVRHRNIVDVTDLVELADGTTFIIMELLTGRSLGAWARSGSETPRILAVLVQICDGLAAAHALGVVHRDLKPDNVIVGPTPDGELVKLLDFGVAKLLNRDDEDIGFETAAGSVIGTPAYMSPEQAGGMLVDARSDIYSLGAIMYELFCGQPMFRGRSFGEYVRKHLTEIPVAPRLTTGGAGIPPALEAVILRCLDKDPAQRFPHVLALRAALLGVLAAHELPAAAAPDDAGPDAVGAAHPAPTHPVRAAANPTATHHPVRAAANPAVTHHPVRAAASPAATHRPVRATTNPVATHRPASHPPSVALAPSPPPTYVPLPGRSQTFGFSGTSHPSGLLEAARDQSDAAPATETSGLVVGRWPVTARDTRFERPVLDDSSGGPSHMAAAPIRAAQHEHVGLIDPVGDAHSTAVPAARAPMPHRGRFERVDFVGGTRIVAFAATCITPQPAADLDTAIRDAARSPPWWTWIIGGVLAVATGVGAAIWYAGHVETAAPRSRISASVPPATVPAHPRLIEIRFDARPDGGVFAEGQPTELCQTPCAYNINLDDGGPADVRRFIIQRPGYDIGVVTVDLTRNQRTFHVVLSPLPATSPAASASPPSLEDPPTSRPDHRPSKRPRATRATRVTKSSPATKPVRPLVPTRESSFEASVPDEAVSGPPTPTAPDAPAEKSTRPAIDPADTLDPFRTR